MDNKGVDSARIVLKCFGVVAAVFALIGSIGCPVSVGINNSLASLGSSSAARLGALNAVMSLVHYYDFARVGAIILFGFASILAVLDKASGSAERGTSILTNTMAALGLAAVIATSLWLTFLLAYEEQMKYIRYWDQGGYTYSSASSGQFVRTLYTVAMIIIMLAAIAMIISLIYSICRIIASKTAARGCADQQYAQHHTQSPRFMNETIVKRLRSGITGALVLFAIVALLGAIAIFVTMGIASGSYKSSDEQFVLIEILVCAWDLLRTGGFGMFTCSLISVIFELFGKVPGRHYAFVMLGGSVFGLISGFMLSIRLILKAAMQTSANAYSDFLGGSGGSGIITTASVFGIVSAVTVFVGLGMRGMKPQYPQQSARVQPAADLNKQ